MTCLDLVKARAGGIALYTKRVRKMSTRSIKEAIPRLVYEAMLMSVDILLNEHLRSRKPERKKEAAAVFLSKLSDAAFIKNLALLTEEASRTKDKHKPAKAEWSK